MKRGLIVVIGAGDAIGSAICDVFSNEGYHVVGARRQGSKLEEKFKGKITAVSLDARIEDDVIKFFSSLKTIHSPPLRLVGVIHNIGANVSFPITETTSRVYRKVWEMACFSAFLTGREAAKVMLQDLVKEESSLKSEGKITPFIFFTGATASIRGNPTYAAFAGAKHAKRALAQSMSRELGPKGIHVAHLIVDSPVETEFVKERIGEELFQKLQKEKALLNPKDIAKCYYFLSQQDPSAFTFEMDLRPAKEKF